MHPNNIYPNQGITWQQWKLLYRDRLTHVAGYEERFVDEILTQVCQPYEVVPQYHFLDSKSKNRFIDFMICRSGEYIPIELDGFSKMVEYGANYHENYERFNDFLERQNSLVMDFNFILRYSNRKWQNEPDEVIREISWVLFMIDMHTERQSNQIILEQIVWYNPIHFIKSLYYLAKYLYKGNTLNQLLSFIYQYIKNPS